MLRIRSLSLVACALLAATPACSSDDMAATSSSSTGTGGSGGMENVAPAAPTAFATAPDGCGLALTWTAPADADIAGYIVARSDAAIADGQGPEANKTYKAGDTLPGGATVVYVGAEAKAMDATPVLFAESHYAVWAVDASGLYSSAASTTVTVQPPAEVATIEVAKPTTTPTFTVTKQACHFPLKVTGSFNDSTSALELTVELENQLGRHVFNPKVSIDKLGEGTATSDGSFAGKPVAYYGATALATGAKASRNVAISGLASADPLKIDVSVLWHPAVIVPSAKGLEFEGGMEIDHWARAVLEVRDASGAVDNDGNALGGTFSYKPGFRESRGSLRPGVFSPDGAFYYAGGRNIAKLFRFDTTTWTETTTAALSVDGVLGNLSNVAISPDGANLYVTVLSGSHGYGNEPKLGDETYTGMSGIDFVKLDRLTLTEKGRLSLVASQMSGNGQIKAPWVAVSPDGKRALIAMWNAGRVEHIDLTTMTRIDADPNTDGVQGFDVSSASMQPRVVAFGGPMQQHAFVSFQQVAETDPPLKQVFAAIDLSAMTVTKLESPFSRSRPGGVLALDGRFLVGLKIENGPLFASYDPVANAWKSSQQTGTTSGLVALPAAGGLLVLNNTTKEMQAFNPTTLEPSTLDGHGAIPAKVGHTHQSDLSPF